MTSDLEDRLASRLESRALDLPTRPDRLNAVRSRGRRLRFRARAAIATLGLAALTMVVVAGVTLFPGTETSTTEVAAGSHQKGDLDRRDEKKNYRSSDRDRRGEGRTRHGKRTMKRTARDDRRQFRYGVGPDSDVLAIPATSTTASSSTPDSEDQIALGSNTSTTTPDPTNPDPPKVSSNPGDSAPKDDPSEVPNDKPTTTRPIKTSTTDRQTSTPAPTDPSSTTEPTTKPPVDAGLASIGNFAYRGAFRVSSQDYGASSSNYAVGTLAYNRANRSLFIVGHSHDNAIAEFTIPNQLGTSRSLSSLPVVDKPRQPFTTVLDRVSNPDALDRITGLYVLDNSLVVNAERWYDASGGARDTTLVISNANDLDGQVTGMHKMEGGAKAAGYMSPVPSEWQSTVGGSILSGWASNYSIISRYSQGPSLFGLDAGSIKRTSPGPIATNTQMVFPENSPLASNARETKRGTASPTWNFLSRGVYGFIVPGTRTFAVVGSSGGIDSGIGYKITQDNGNLCGGYCSYKAADVYNYYWLFDLDEIASAKDPSSPRPYDSGRWSVPFDGNGQHRINGATFDPESSTLYMSLDEAGQVGSYDRPPVIVAYQIK